jgi:hypothetical protein
MIKFLGFCGVKFLFTKDPKFCLKVTVRKNGTIYFFPWYILYPPETVGEVTEVGALKFSELY